ncbi:MAG: hypothetical protein GX643_06540 [Acidimicrobiales bacterium]|nr:hypothetical protein [Acidimicrobiales bacterium]
MRWLWWKIAVIGPAVVAAGAVWLVVLASVPAQWAPMAAAAVAFAVVVLAGGAGEGVAARVTMGSRGLNDEEASSLRNVLVLLCREGIGPAVGDLRVRPGAAEVSAGGLGRGTVVLSAGLIDGVRCGGLPADQAAAVIGHAVLRVKAGCHRWDALLWLWLLPLRPLQLVWAVLVEVGSRVPGAQLLWKARAVVFCVAIANFLDLGEPGFAILIGILGAASYVVPVARGRWEKELAEIGDSGLALGGLGTALITFLRRCHQSPQTRARLVRLTSASVDVTGPALAR